MKRILSFILVLALVCTMLPQFTVPIRALSSGAGEKYIEGGQRDFGWPVPGWFGLSSCFIDNRSPAHCAIDIPADQGTEVVASYNGEVVKVYDKCTHNYFKKDTCCGDGFGNFVVLRHEYKLANGASITLYSRYSHLTSVCVGEGDKPRKGDPIGTVGSTGYSQGMHLDFQILENTWETGQYRINSRDPFINELLDLPDEIFVASTKDCCGVGPTGCCCYYYLQDVKNIYAKPQIVKKSYPAWSALQVSTDVTYLKTMPCSRETDPNSDDVARLEKGTPLLATQLVQNKFDNLWYKVETLSGLTGYVYAGDVNHIGFGYNDISTPGVTVPANHTQGKTYVLTGEVKSIGNRLTNISVYIYDKNGNKVTGDNVDVDLIGGSYPLGGSPIDTKTYFNHLSVGTYTYEVAVSYENYHAVSAKEVSKPNKGTEVIYRATFNVTSGVVSCSHAYTNKVTTAVTCVSNGVRTYTCTKCGASYTETIPATGEHTYGSWTTTQAATCTTAGTQQKKCSGCGLTQTQSIAAKGHSYGSWVTTTAAGCTTVGTQKKTCSTCGDVQTTSISALGHNYKSKTISATCTEKEKIRYTCQNCGDTYEKYTEDAYYGWSTTKPTGVSEDLIESKKQYRYRTISCSTEYTSWGSWSDWQDSAVTKTELTDVETQTLYPYYYYYCKRCGDGTRWYSYGSGCGACGTIMESSSGTVVWLTTPWSEAVPYNPYGTATGKYAIHVNGLAYWKWTDGSPKTQYRYRTRSLYQVTNYGNWTDWSDTVYTSSSVREVESRTLYRYLGGQLGNHTWDSGVITKNPSCGETGIKTFTCTVCNDQYTETIAAKGEHHYTETITTPATCGSQGVKTYICSSCKDQYTEKIPATGSHNWGDWIVIEQATCGNAGWWERQCCDCAEEDIFIPGYASHNLVTISGYPATCTEDGLTDGLQCSNCGEVAVAQEVIPATGHAWGQWTQTQAPSCAVEGINMRTCNCGASETEVIPMLVHSYEDGFCTTCGAYEFEIVASGKCGDNVHWVLYVTGTLVIYGTGAMTNYSPYSSAPWCSNGGDVKIAIIENGVTSIGQCAFRYCVGLTSVAIGNGVTSIGDEAFDNCTSLTSIVIPDSVTRIGDSAFDGCTGLTSVTIPDSVTRIGSHAFIRCKRLTSITIGNGVTSIGPAAFSSCGKLNSVCFNASNCTVMGSSTGQVFSSCTSLTTVNIGKNVLTIPAYAFDGCSSLTSVAIPDSVTSIGDAAFRSCSGLTSIAIPDSVISIGGSAFKGCTGLTSMTIPDSVTSIGGAAFQDCYNLTRVAIPDSITSIGCGTFRGCQNLIRVTIPDSVTCIGDEAFDYCTSLAAVVIPSSVTSIGDDAFDYCINLAYVIYCGTEEQWNNISIGSGKTQLTSVREYHNWNGTACGNNRVCNYCSALESYSWTLCADTVVDICLTEDLYIDLNGFDLTGTINTNGFKVYGMDSSTNEYTCDNMGHFSCVDENGNAIVPESLYTTDDMMRYMTIETDNGYTFHRYYLGITNISLAPSVTGFGYKAEFYGDEVVQSQIAAIGYNLWITEDRVISRTSDFENTLTLRLKNFDAENYGETPVNACVSITLVDGTLITGETHSNTMRQVVETVNRNHASYSETQIQAVQEMIEANTVMKSWDVDSLLEDEWFTDDEFWD